VASLKLCLDDIEGTSRKPSYKKKGLQRLLLLALKQTETAYIMKCNIMYIIML